MSKIIKEQEVVNRSVSTTFIKDLGLFQVRATIWSCVSEYEGRYENEITETELMFILNGKTCRYVGFRELYEKLYGVKMFNQFRCARLRDAPSLPRRLLWVPEFDII